MKPVCQIMNFLKRFFSSNCVQKYIFGEKKVRVRDLASQTIKWVNYSNILGELFRFGTTDILVILYSYVFKGENIGYIYILRILIILLNVSRTIGLKKDIKITTKIGLITQIKTLKWFVVVNLILYTILIQLLYELADEKFIYFLVCLLILHIYFIILRSFFGVSVREIEHQLNVLHNYNNTGSRFNRMKAAFMYYTTRIVDLKNNIIILLILFLICVDLSITSHGLLNKLFITYFQNIAVGILLIIEIFSETFLWILRFNRSRSIKSLEE